MRSLYFSYFFNLIALFFALFIVFQDIFISFLPRCFDYWDEIFTIICFFIYCCSYIKKVNKNNFVILLFFLLSILICAFGNIVYGYQTSIDACFRDILAILKFPIVFLCFSRLDFSNVLVKEIYRIVPVIKFIVIVAFGLGIVSLFLDIGLSQDELRFGIHPYFFIFSHPTYLTTCFAFLLCLYNSSSTASKSAELMLVFCILLAMRTKGIVFVCLYYFVKFFYSYLKSHIVIFSLTLLFLIIVVSYDKIQLYNSFSNSPRESLYKGSIYLLFYCFPFGAGLGAFASHLSAKFDSNVYNFIMIPDMYDQEGNLTAVIGDAGLPYYVGQFGLFGLIVIILAYSKIFQSSVVNLTFSKNSSVFLLWGLILITMPTEAILINNGVVIAIYLIILRKFEILKNSRDFVNGLK